MNSGNQGFSPDFPESNHLRRKRGRPRKDRSQSLPGLSNVQSLSNSIQHCGEGVPVPPGFEGINGNRLHQPKTTDDHNDTEVGQVVTGVIEAAFDAGYLLSVRVGDSITRLRGVVFKPGHYTPVTAGNDVVPHFQMIRRNEVPFPASNGTQVHGNHSRGRERSNYHAMHLAEESKPSNQLVRYKSKSNGSPPANQLAVFSDTQMPSVPNQRPLPLGGRGTVVPVLLQPVTLSNGSSPAVEAPPLIFKPAHLGGSKQKHDRLLSHTQSTNDAIPRSSEKHGNSSFQSAKDTDSISPGKPFDRLVNEVAKRVDGGSSLSDESRNEIQKSAGGGSSSKASGQGLSHPLLIKPLPAIRTENSDQPFQRTGKMTELLLAVQENLIEKQEADARTHVSKKPRT